MRRMMVVPTQFGSNSGYNWEDVDTAQEAHHDYCTLYQDDYSIRVWEPGRNRYSEPTYAIPGGTNLQASPEARGCTIHGIKGNAYIRLDGTADGVGRWRDTDGVLLDPQPSPTQTYDALSGAPFLSTPYLGITTQAAYEDRNGAFSIPIFCALYRGTYKVIDDQPGWEIDSGPTDDASVLLGLDITDPTVLESGRLDWWDLDFVRLPRNDVTWDSGGTAGVDGRRYTRIPGGLGGSMHRYALNLDANKRMRADQVLWLHWKTGTIRLPVAVLDAATGTYTAECHYYQGHKFSMSVQASMLVTEHK